MHSKLPNCLAQQSCCNIWSPSRVCCAWAMLEVSEQHHRVSCRPELLLSADFNEVAPAIKHLQDLLPYLNIKLIVTRQPHYLIGQAPKLYDELVEWVFSLIVNAHNKHYMTLTIARKVFHNTTSLCMCFWQFHINYCTPLSLSLSSLAWHLICPNHNFSRYVSWTAISKPRSRLHLLVLL